MLSIFISDRLFAMEKEEVIRLHLGESAKIERQILGGMMNGSFLVDYQNKKYILYMPTEQANEMVDRKEEKRHLDIVYPLGITSKNVFFDIEKGIKINEFIEGESLNNLDNYDEEKVANILRKLCKKYDRVIFVDDDHKNVSAARNLNIKNLRVIKAWDE